MFTLNPGYCYSQLILFFVSKDLFSSQALTYAKYRPQYPTELFEYILRWVNERNLVWDCATGNGQAALALANYFEKVFATDSSEKQIANAVLLPNIDYSVSKAEQTAFPDNTFDLVTVAQAYHWLNAEAFTKEVKRVAKPGAIIAIWGYNTPLTRKEELNEQIRYFYKDVVGSFWDKERKYVEEEYRSVAFDFQEIPARHFIMEVQWNIEHLAGYLKSWSSVQHYLKAMGHNPVDAFLPRLKEYWPEEQEIPFQFPVFLRVGKIIKTETNL